jgi:hypothetical protein
MSFSLSSAAYSPSSDAAQYFTPAPPTDTLVGQTTGYRPVIVTSKYICWDTSAVRRIESRLDERNFYKNQATDLSHIITKYEIREAILGEQNKELRNSINYQTDVSAHKELIIAQQDKSLLQIHQRAIKQERAKKNWRYIGISCGALLVTLIAFIVFVGNSAASLV